MVATLFRFIQIVMALGFFFLLIGTRSPRRRAHPEYHDPQLGEGWRRPRPTFAAHERLARLKLRRIRTGAGQAGTPKPGERRAA